jgi:radical SAM superfamily enzyme YgiQ (UPF0313 family)
MSKKVVFFFPSFASSEATAPLGILAVATPLLNAGYSVKLIDSTITPNFKKRVLEEIQDALCLGISLVTGPMIRETAEIARAVKARNPDFPVILGGWHPSLLPKQTLEAEYIDIVVRGQGEESLLDVVRHLENSAPTRHRFQARQETYLHHRAVTEAPRGFSAEGLSHRRFRRLRTRLWPPLGDVHIEPCVHTTAPTARMRACTDESGMRCPPSRSWRKHSTSRGATGSNCSGSSTTIFSWTWIVPVSSPMDWFVRTPISAGAFRPPRT